MTSSGGFIKVPTDEVKRMEETSASAKRKRDQLKKDRESLEAAAAAAKQAETRRGQDAKSSK